LQNRHIHDHIRLLIRHCDRPHYQNCRVVGSDISADSLPCSKGLPCGQRAWRPPGPPGDRRIGATEWLRVGVCRMNVTSSIAVSPAGHPEAMPATPGRRRGTAKLANRGIDPVQIAHRPANREPLDSMHVRQDDAKDRCGTASLARPPSSGKRNEGAYQGKPNERVVRRLRTISDNANREPHALYKRRFDRNRQRAAAKMIRCKHVVRLEAFKSLAPAGD
jgi:hypothetical protein